MLSPLLPLTKTIPEVKLHIDQPNTKSILAVGLTEILCVAKADRKDPVVLCIGTDRSTGDALGPITGSNLQSMNFYPYIYGTLDTPVHATNLPETLKLIQQCFTHPFIIAVDACLGRLENVGYVSLGMGSLKPGAAVRKDLPPVGDAYITGIVNVGGFMEHLVLQSTRLNLVIKMADVIAHALGKSLRENY